jgi:hypothetical protein
VLNLILSGNDPGRVKTPAYLARVGSSPANLPTNVEMTKAIISACQVLGIAVHDHVIIAKHGHASFKDLRLM